MPSSLQLWLAVLGGLGLAGLVAYNTWTTRKARVKVAEPLDPGRPAEPVEPMFGDAPDTVPQPRDDDGAPSGSSDSHGEGGHATTSAPDGDAAAALPAAAPVRRAGPRLDPLIDAMATLRLDAPTSGEHALAHQPATRRAGSKPLFIEGLDTETGEWEPLQAGRRYGEFQAGVQMANRVGAINEIEYSEFVQKVQAFADAVGAEPDFPDMLDVVARARELDQFASAHDAQLVLRLRAKGSAWSVGYVQQHASRHGFIPGVIPGRLVLPAREEGAPPILSLTFDAQAAFADDPNQSAVRELTLAFDVPQTAPELEPFLAWRAAGEALGHTLQATVTDDSGQVLTPPAFDAIGVELARLYEALAQRDLAAGTPVARRLFS